MVTLGSNIEGFGVVAAMMIDMFDQSYSLVLCQSDKYNWWLRNGAKIRINRWQL